MTRVWPPASGSTPPTTLVPPPKGTTAIPRRSHSDRSASVSACEAGETTASGAGWGSPRRRASRSGVLLPPRWSVRAASSEVTSPAPTIAAKAPSSSGVSREVVRVGALPARDGVRLAREDGRDERLRTGRKPCGRVAPGVPRRSRPRSGDGDRRVRQRRRRIHRDSMTHSVWLSHGRRRHRDSAPRRRARRGARARHPPDDRIRHRPPRGRVAPDPLPLLARRAGAAGGARDARTVRGRPPRGHRGLARRVRRGTRRDRRPDPLPPAGRPAARHRSRAVRAVHPRPARHESARHPSRARCAHRRRSVRRVRPRRRARSARGDAAADRAVGGAVRAARGGVAVARRLAARAARRRRRLPADRTATGDDPHRRPASALDRAERGPSRRGSSRRWATPRPWTCS